MISSAPLPTGSRKTKNAADDRDEIGRNRGDGDDLDARADLQSAGRGVEGTTEAISAAAVHGLISSSTPLAMSSARNLIAISETPNSAPAVAPRSRPCAAGGTRRWVEIAATAAPATKDAALDRDQRRRGVVRRIAVVRPRGQPDDREPCRRDDHADPLAASEPEAEEALGEDGEEHQPAREDGLHDRQRRQGERADVEHPGADRDRPADREPLGAEEVDGASQRVPDLARRAQGPRRGA